jgi:hypothetical protein
MSVSDGKPRTFERYLIDLLPPSPFTVGYARRLHVDIRPKQPTMKGAAETFTGDVWIDSVVRGEEPSRVRVNVVRFTPGARTAWHSHALGQTLYVTEGVGRAQSRGEGAVPRRGDHRDPPRRHRCHPPGRVALARCHARRLHGPLLHHRRSRRRAETRGRLGRARHRRRVPREPVRADTAKGVRGDPRSTPVQTIREGRYSR